MKKRYLLTLCMGIVWLSLPRIVKAKDHYILDLYFSKNAVFYDFPAHLQEGVARSIVQNLKPWISGNVAEHSYTIVLNELSSQPSSEVGLTRIILNLSFDDLTSNLLSVLQLPPTGPPCPDYLSRTGPLQYINSQLPAGAYFEHTYFFYVSSNRTVDEWIDPASPYQRSLDMLDRNATIAQRYFNITGIADNISAPAIYSYDNSLDSMYDGNSCELFLQKHELSFADELLAKIASGTRPMNNLVLDRRTLGNNRLALFPSKVTDSFCTMNVLHSLPNLNFIPDHCEFLGGVGSNNTGFTVPARWCLQNNDGSPGCGMVQPDTSMMLGRNGGQQFPIYRLLMPYLIISGEYGMNYTYTGSCAVSGNLITGVYDHLVYTDTLDYTLSLLPPLYFKKAGHAEVVLDNPTLLAKAADLFDGQSVTQDQVMEALKEGTTNRKIIIIAIIGVAILLVLYFYFTKANKSNPISNILKTKKISGLVKP